MKKRITSFIALSLVSIITLATGSAQTLPSGQPQQGTSSGSASQGSGGTKKTSSPLGQEIPIFDPTTEVMTWNGMSFDIKDNRIFRARFDKYLNSPEQTTKEEIEYNAIIDKIMEHLSPQQTKKTGGRSLDEAYALLPDAAEYEIDAKLCDALANAVYNVWLAKKENVRLNKANESLERKRSTLEWNYKMSIESSKLDSPPRDPAKLAQWQKEQEIQREARTQPHQKRLVEVEATIKANQAKREAQEITTKIEFQVLMVQFFVQRRFQHVLMAAGFYRNLFGDGDSKLHVGKESKAMFADLVGSNPTVGVVESISYEAVKDVKEGVDAFRYLLGNNELYGASQRLQEAFLIGEYLAPVRGVSRDEKRGVSEFQRKSSELISTLQVKDYVRAQEIVDEMKLIAKDLDTSKAKALIESQMLKSNMHLAKAQNYVAKGDTDRVETELKEAAEVWPGNPKLKEIASKISEGTNVTYQTLSDFDRLLSQKNYRQIYEESYKYIAAIAMFPDRQKDLEDVMKRVQEIELSITKADEVAKRGDYPGAWETVEIAFAKFPDDSKLNQRRADYTTRAADFVKSIRNAQELEQKEQAGSSLAWFLKAQSMYPQSQYAHEGIDRLIKKIFPEDPSSEEESAEEAQSI